MWIARTLGESKSDRRAKLLRSTLQDVLLGMGMWWALVQFYRFLSPNDESPVSGYVACGVMLILLPASWFANWRRTRRSSTMVCDCCHALKPADHCPDCRCGGTFRDLADMRWVDEEEYEDIVGGKSRQHTTAGLAH